MKRFLVSFFVAILVFCPFFVRAEESRVLDPHSFLSEVERAELESELAEAVGECGFDIRVVVYDGALREWSMLDMLSASEYDDLAVFLITRESGIYYYELFLYGEPDGLIDWDTSDEILDTPLANSSIKAGKIAEGTISLLAATRTATSDIRSGRWVGVIVATAIIAALAGGGTALGIYFSYKKKQKSPSYPLSKYANLDLTDASDAFIGSSIVKTRVSSSSTRGGSRGGGGSRGRR